MPRAVSLALTAEHDTGALAFKYDIMKILVVHNFYKQRGGEDAVVEQEVALLRRNGHEVVEYFAHNDSIVSWADKLNTFLGTCYSVNNKKLLYNALIVHRPDIVHVHNFFPILSPSIFDSCIEAGVPSVMTLHNFRILCPTCFLYYDDTIRERSLHGTCWWTVPLRVYRQSFMGTLALANMVETHKRRGTWRKKVDQFIALTDFAREKFVEGGLPADRITVKGNTVHDTTPGPGPGPGPSGGRHGALFVGRLSEEKGVKTLLDAWEGLAYPLRVVGDGPLDGDVRARAGRAIEPLGRLPPDEVRGEMNKASFLVLSSVWYEMFPMVVPEAFSCGLPVIVSRLAGLQSLVREGETGLHFDPRNSRDLAEKVKWAASHPAEMERMGQNARAEFAALYTSDGNYRRLMSTYDRAIAQAAFRAARSGDFRIALTEPIGTIKAE